MKNIVVISHEFRRCLLRVDDDIRSAKLLHLELSDFDIILGFLASIKDTLLDGPLLESHLVVRNFPDELLILPPERRVEFIIDLIPGAQPKSKAPFIIVFIDDILVCSNTRNEHEDHLSIVLEISQLLKDYDANIHYHPGKANVLALSLSRKNSRIMACLKIEPEIIKDLELMKVQLVVRGYEGYIARHKIEPNLILRIKEAQNEDKELWSVLEGLKEGKQAEV
uniref:Putative reverse transcriptase domain-containing protein n=1 Tax=Tanacetum cinerariifolium TaxID=118510 RepID=A0A699HCK9_TANCI|nr:putative reverse transcriptase domain-containing protein [Tanacetum cinerariifolium]GEX88636.1 putative reverse transcriptase domain-containing protein [Tanacetum cinerariifolium]